MSLASAEIDRKVKEEAQISNSIFCIASKTVNALKGCVSTATSLRVFETGSNQIQQT